MCPPRRPRSGAGAQARQVAPGRSGAQGLRRSIPAARQATRPPCTAEAPARPSRGGGRGRPGAPGVRSAPPQRAGTFPGRPRPTAGRPAPAPGPKGPRRTPSPWSRGRASSTTTPHQDAEATGAPPPRPPYIDAGPPGARRLFQKPPEPSGRTLPNRRGGDAPAPAPWPAPPPGAWAHAGNGRAPLPQRPPRAPCARPSAPARPGKLGKVSRLPEPPPSNGPRAPCASPPSPPRHVPLPAAAGGRGARARVPAKSAKVNLVLGVSPFCGSSPHQRPSPASGARAG